MSIFNRTLEAILVLVLAASMGCGKKDNPPTTGPKSDQNITNSDQSSNELPQQPSSSPPPLDEILQNAEKQIKEQNYGPAISILESYRSEHKEHIATKHILLADAYFGELKNYVQQLIDRDYHDLNILEQRIFMCNQRIKQSINAAIGLNPRYAEKIWDIYLVQRGKIKDQTTTSSHLDTLRSFLYSMKTKDKDLFLQSTNFEEQREKDIKKREGFVQDVKKNPGYYGDGDDKRTIKINEEYIRNLRAIQIFGPDFVKFHSEVEKIVSRIDNLNEDVIILGQEVKKKEIVLNLLFIDSQGRFFYKDSDDIFSLSQSQRWLVKANPNENYRGK